MDKGSVLEKVASKVDEKKSILEKAPDRKSQNHVRRPRARMVRFGAKYKATGYKAMDPGANIFSIMNDDILQNAKNLLHKQTEDDDDTTTDDDVVEYNDQDGEDEDASPPPSSVAEKVAEVGRKIRLLLDFDEGKTEPSKRQSDTFKNFASIGLTSDGPHDWRKSLAPGSILNKFSFGNPAAACFFPTRVDGQDGDEEFIDIVPMIVGFTIIPQDGTDYTRVVSPAFPCSSSDGKVSYKDIPFQVDERFAQPSRVVQTIKRAAHALGGLNVFTNSGEPIFVSVDPGNAEVDKGDLGGGSYSLAVFCALAGLPIGPLVTGDLIGEEDDIAVGPIGALWEKIDAAVGGRELGQLSDSLDPISIIYAADGTIPMSATLDRMVKQDMKNSITTGIRKLGPVSNLTDVIQWYHTYYQRSIRPGSLSTSRSADLFAAYRAQIEFAAGVESLRAIHEKMAQLTAKSKLNSDERRELRVLMKDFEAKKETLISESPPKKKKKRKTRPANFRLTVNVPPGGDGTLEPLPLQMAGFMGDAESRAEAFDVKRGIQTLEIAKPARSGTRNFSQSTSGLQVYATQDGFNEAKAWRARVNSNLAGGKLRWKTTMDKKIASVSKYLKKYTLALALAANVGTVIVSVDPTDTSRIATALWVPGYVGTAVKLSKKKKGRARNSNRDAMMFLQSLKSDE